MMSKSEQATKIFFWLAFGAFLAMSVPHVAWVFRYYEPKHDGHDMAWWLVSYGVAISIDLLICWLSYSRAGQQQSAGDGFIIWSFIVLLAILSWYCNWIFAEAMSGVDVWSVPLLWGWTVGTLTPLIVSGIPMFMIGYTYMSKKILGAKPKSAAELKQEVDELAAKLTEKSRLNDLKNRQLSDWISGKKQVLLTALSPGNPLQQSQQTEQLSEEFETEVPAERPENEAQNEPVEQLVFEQNGEQEVEPVETVAQEPIPLEESGHKYLMTFEEAAQYTGYAISTLRKQLKAGEIEASKNGEKLKVSSLKIRTGTAAKMPAVKVDKVSATNGYH